MGPTTPARQRRRPVTPHWFGLFPFRSPLLRESLLLSVPRGTEMFQFPRLPQPALCVQTGVTGHDPSLVSQFGHPRVGARLTAHRGLSQPATSFIGSWRQGIHHQPVVAWIVFEYFDFSCSLCSSQRAGGSRSRPRCDRDLSGLPHD